MAESNFRGPLVSMGGLESVDGSLFDGPSLLFQGHGVPDPRFNPMLKDGVGPARVPSFLAMPYIVVTDQIPSTLSTNVLASSVQSSVTASAIVLNATSLGGSAAGVPSVAYGVPFVPFGTSVATTVIALDFGFTTGTTAAASSTVVVVDSSMFTLGQWVCIGGAGNTGNSSSLLTQVTTITNATTIKVSPVAVGALSHAPIGNANLQNPLNPPATNFGPSTPVPTGVFPYFEGGLGTFFSPVEGVSRGISVASNTTQGTATIVFTGFDVYGVPMTEQVTVANATAFTKKAFKYLLGASFLTASLTGTYQVGVSDIFGCNIRADRYEALDVVWNGKNLAATAGFTAAFSGVVSTNTSADVRGTLAVSAFTAFNAAASNGTGRLFVGVKPPLINALNANAGSTAATSMFGTAQA